MKMAVNQFSTDTGKTVSTLADLRRQFYLLFLHTQGINKQQFTEAAREAIRAFQDVEPEKTFDREFMTQVYGEPDLIDLYSICQSYLNNQTPQNAIKLFANIDKYQFKNPVHTQTDKKRCIKNGANRV